MIDASESQAPRAAAAASSRTELIVFLFITAVIWPLVAVGVVGGYGFFVWMYQMMAGPPGPPGW